MRERLLIVVVLVAVVLVALLTRVGAVIVPLKDFDADEAVVGLMARDILAGNALPVYYAGQSYLGALEPWSAAASFGLLGESARNLRLVPLLYTLAFLVAAFGLLLRFFSLAEAGLILLWTALGTPFLNLWTVKARGGFAELLLLGTLFLLVFYRYWGIRNLGARRLLTLAAITAFGLFVNPMVGALMAVPLLLLAARARQECRPLLQEEGWSAGEFLFFRPAEGGPRLLFLIFAAIGLLAAALAFPLLLVGDATLEGWVGVSLPNGTELLAYVLLYFALLYSAEVVFVARQRRGGFARLSRRLWDASAALQMLVVMAVGHLVFSLFATVALALLGGGGHSQSLRLAPLVSWPGRVLLLFGEIVPTASWRLAGLSGPLMLGLCLWLGFLLIRRRGEFGLRADGSPAPISPLVLFGGTTLVTMLLVVTSAYAQDAAAARYLLPLLVSLPATVCLLANGVAAALGGRPAARVVLLGLLTVAIAAGSAWAPASMLSPRVSGSPYPGLVAEIDAHGATTVVADYWTAYPLAFLSRGRISVAPADGADRFPAASARVLAETPDMHVFVEGSGALVAFRASPEAATVSEDVLRPAENTPRYHLFWIAR